MNSDEFIVLMRGRKAKSLWNFQKEDKGTKFPQPLVCRECGGQKRLKVVALFIPVY